MVLLHLWKIVGKEGGPSLEQRRSEWNHTQSF